MPTPTDPQLETLSRVPLFANLKPKHLRSISDAGRRSSYEPGEKIVRKGEEGNSLYLILDGEVEVRSGTRVLASLGKRNFFGEIALLDNRPRSADIVAVAPTTCLMITARSFERIIHDDPGIIQEIVAELIRRLRKANVSMTE